MFSLLRRMLALIMLLVGINGCQHEEIVMGNEPGGNNGNNNPREFVASIKLGGEILDITEGPLTKAAGNNLYRIEVQAKESGSNWFLPYAYGVFDDPSNISIKLQEGVEYEIRGTMIVNAKSIIKHSFHSTPVQYGYPISGCLTNSFDYVSSFYSTVESGTIDKAGIPIGENSMISFPNCDRYYGAIACNNVTADTELKLEMKRAVFGLRFEVKNLKSGSVLMSIVDSYNSASSEDYKITYGGEQFIDNIFCAERILSLIDDDKENIILLVKDDAGEILVRQEITIQRLKKTTVVLDMDKLPVNPTKGVGIVLENAPITDGERIEI